MTTGLLGSDVVLAERYDVALLDLDGVVYLGPNAIEGVPDALAQARGLGMRLAFVTNNAARPPKAVADHLTELGIPAEPAEITTSAQAAAHYLAERLPTGARVLVVGTEGLVEALTERGLKPVNRDAEDVAAIVQGYSPDLTWRQLAEGAIAINRGALWVATNLDPTVPSPRGRLPGNGSLVAALRYATGATPVSTGKPDPTMHRESVQRAAAQRPIVVGDRLDTDIEGANAVGCPSLLVFTGVTTAAELLAAPENLRPSFLAADVSGLLQRHVRPVSVDGQVECGPWRVQTFADTARGPEDGSLSEAEINLVLTYPDGVAVIEADEGGPASKSRSELDALRALCAATWQTSGSVRYLGADDASKRALSTLGLA
jgi:HAD superfamily hydrolase (TIGR01450 family)